MSGFFARTKARLGKKLGPLPTWVYVAVALALGLWYYRRKNTATAGASAAGSTAASAQDATLGLPSTGDGGGGGGGAPPPGLQPNPDTAPVSWDPGQAPPKGPSTLILATPPPDAGVPPAVIVPTSTAPTPASSPGPGTPVTPPESSPPTGPAPTRVSAAPPPAPSVVSPAGKVEPAPAGAKLVTPSSFPSLLDPTRSLPIVVPKGATDVARLPTGAVTYTGPGGAKIEQAAGSSRYRVAPAPTAAESKPRAPAQGGGGRTALA